jgi:transcriptional regulator with XRE-family HTH domain
LAHLEEVLATRLRELARERRTPISHVADRCGLAHSYFWQLLKAEASATLAVVQRLAEALDVDPLVLLGGNPVVDRVDTHAQKAPQHEPRHRPALKVAAEKSRPRGLRKPKRRTSTRS